MVGRRVEMSDKIVRLLSSVLGDVNDYRSNGLCQTSNLSTQFIEALKMSLTKHMGNTTDRDELLVLTECWDCGEMPSDICVLVECKDRKRCNLAHSKEESRKRVCMSGVNRVVMRLQMELLEIKRREELEEIKGIIILDMLSKVNIDEENDNVKKDVKKDVEKNAEGKDADDTEGKDFYEWFIRGSIARMYDESEETLRDGKENAESKDFYELFRRESKKEAEEREKESDKVEGVREGIAGWYHLKGNNGEKEDDAVPVVEDVNDDEE